MNKIILYLGIALATLTACGGQKPSDRVRGKESADSISVTKVAFTRPYSNPASTPEVQVTMNGVPFKMLWDTGATITAISTQELKQLIKDNAITDDDLIGEMSVTVADGSTVDVPVINIDELSIATDGEPYVVNKVQVVVVLDPGASLLLGQNVMKELPGYTVNDIDQTFEFENSK